MIRFKQISIKNFLSVGDNPLVLQLDRSPMTMIQGANGVGKTAICAESIHFALFGKSYRGINKSSLINTVNQKDCVVSLEFDHNGSQYKINRGIKPNMFKVSKDGKELNQEAAVRDMQTHLETQVLGFDSSAFIKTCLLSTMNYTPFMQLGAAERRSLSDTLLDIGIYTKMSGVAKEFVSKNKMKAVDVEKDLANTKLRLADKKAMCDMLVQSDQTKIDDLKTQARKIKKLMDDKLVGVDKFQVAQLATKVDEMSKDIQEKTNGAEYLRHVRDIEHNTFLKLQEKLKEAPPSTCGECGQAMDPEHLAKTEAKFTAESLAHFTAYEDLSKKYELITDEIRTRKDSLAADLSLLRCMEQTLSEAEGYKRDLMSIKKQIEQEQARSMALSDNIEEEIRDLENKVDEYETVMKKLLKEKELLADATDILKDSGIKASVIKKYVPMLTSFVNLYLSKLNFAIKFEMDEQFNVALRSRYADEFTYMNLSAGERARIDVALALAWRQVSKMKNSVNCNLLILDEILDASLDANGTDDLMDLLLEVCSDQNLFIVSHKGSLDEKVRSIVRLEKVNGFTRISS